MIATVTLLFLIIGANARPEGAPTTACQTMVPFHGNGIVRQQGPSPYSINVLRQQGDVLLSIKSSIEIPLQGLMLQGRIRDGELAGVFEPTNGDVHTIDCIQPGDTLTHSHPQGKSAVEVRWKPPLGYVGPVIFNATVAQDYSTFWVGVESETVRISKRFQDDETFEEAPSPPKAVTPPHYVPEVTTPSRVTSDPFYDGCDTKKLCFGEQDGCVGNQDCKAVVAITVIGDRYEFEMKAMGNPAWVGVGLSDDNQMGDDSVLECVKENSGSIKPYLSWTTARPQRLNAVRIPNPQRGIQLLSSSFSDGTLYCKVLRDAKTTINDKEFDLVNTKYFILIAAGSGLKDAGIDYHNLGRLATSSSRYLAEVSGVVGASKILLRLHGAFMLAAWIGTASLGTFIARYYRKTWVGKTICGKDLWFAWHRGLMVATWALTSVAFILIFVELKAWSDTPHAVLGCIVTAICFIQPIGAFFRPHPGTPKRPVFNWLHWLGGNAAHIISIVTIFFAAKLTKAELPEWFDYILVAFVAFHVLMHLVLSILGCMSENSSNQRITAFPMKDLNTSGKMSAHMVNVDAPYSTARKLLLGLYILIVCALTACLIVVAVLAPIKGA